MVIRPKPKYHAYRPFDPEVYAIWDRTMRSLRNRKFGPSASLALKLRDRHSANLRPRDAALLESTVVVALLYRNDYRRAIREAVRALARLDGTTLDEDAEGETLRGHLVTAMLRAGHLERAANLAELLLKERPQEPFVRAAILRNTLYYFKEESPGSFTPRLQRLLTHAQRRVKDLSASVGLEPSTDHDL